MRHYICLKSFSTCIATEHLLGEGIRPEHLNDDRLGRVLDKLYEAGLTEVFVTVALCAARKFGVKMDSATATEPVDLVIIIDTSPSMKDEASDLSNAAAEAIATASSSCPCDLRVIWLGIEGTWNLF